jgi:hypothetical protein
MSEPVEQQSSTGQPVEEPIHRKSSRSTEFFDEKGKPSSSDPETVVIEKDSDTEQSQSRRSGLYAKYRPLILAGLATVILAWWISATVLPATRHRWYVFSTNLYYTPTKFVSLVGLFKRCLPGFSSCSY